MKVLGCWSLLLMFFQLETQDRLEIIIHTKEGTGLIFWERAVLSVDFQKCQCQEHSQVQAVTFVSVCDFKTSTLAITRPQLEQSYAQHPYLGCSKPQVASLEG